MDIKKTIKKYGKAFGIIEILVLLLAIFFVPMGALLLFKPGFWIVSIIISVALTCVFFKYWNKLFRKTED